MFFRFIWGNKPDKVSRNHAKLPEKNGGLGMIDLKDFWLSFRFSWFRRLSKTDAFWPKILCSTLSNILGHSVDTNTILEMGPSKIAALGKKLKNKFWKEVFSSLIPILEGAIFYHPTKILSASFWNNPLFVRNRVIKETDFPNISRKINYLQDFFKVGTNEFLTQQELEEKCECPVTQETYIELSYIVKTSLQKLGMRKEKLPIVQLPVQPMLVGIANITNKGCSSYYRLLRKKRNLTATIQDRETVWHTEIGAVYGVQFWAKAYALTANVKNDNRLKWLQFQIVRNSLFTNHKVNKFNPTVSPLCRNCLITEKISHLVWECVQARDLWQNIQDLLNTLGINVEFTLKLVLFGFHLEDMESLKNTVVLFTKGFIWKTKHEKAPLIFTSWKKYLKLKLEDLKAAYEYLDKLHKFDQWSNIFALL